MRRILSRTRDRSPAGNCLAACGAALLLLAACRSEPPRDAAPAPPTSMPAPAGAAPELNGAALDSLSEAQIGALLAELRSREPDVRRRVVTLARRQIGQRYQLGVLGEGGREPYDRDPLYCLSASDCVTFVEQSWALALSAGWDEFMSNLIRIRYRDGQVGMLTRNHFTEADWNVNNRWLFRDLTRSLAGGRPFEFRVRIDRAAFFRRQGIDRPMAVQVWPEVAIPRATVAAAESRLAGGDVIEFVGGTAAAPYVGHMGLLERDGQGRVWLIHSGSPRVARLRLGEYLAAHPKWLAVKVLRVPGGGGG